MDPPPRRAPDPPPSLDGKRAAKLTAQTEAALARERRELAASFEEAFRHIPVLFRGVVRRTLGL